MMSYACRERCSRPSPTRCSRSRSRAVSRCWRVRPARCAGVATSASFPATRSISTCRCTTRPGVGSSGATRRSRLPDCTLSGGHGALRLYGQSQLEYRSAPPPAIGEVAAHQTGELAGDGEAESQPARRPGIPGDPVIREEHAFPLFLRDAGTLVGYGEPRGVGAGADGDLDGPAPVTERVREEVADDLPHPRRVPDGGGGPDEGHPLPFLGVPRLEDLVDVRHKLDGNRHHAERLCLTLRPSEEIRHDV